MNNDAGRVIPEILVRAGRARIIHIANATDEEEFALQYRAAPDGDWTDFFENGKPVVLNNHNTVVWLTAPGEYRAVANTPIFLAEAQASDDDFPINLTVNIGNRT